MLLNVYTNDMSLIIHDCPTEADKVEVCLTVSVYGCSVQIKYYNTGGFARAVSNHGDKVITAFYRFLKGDIDNMEMQTLHNTLGFSPYYHNINGKNIYAKDLDYGDMRELTARLKPIVYGTLYKVQVPKAYIKLMKTITDLNEINALTGDELVEPEIPYNPNQVRSALQKLADPKMSEFNGNDAMVYDFLGCLEIFTMGNVFIHGDELLTDTLNNRALSGTTYVADVRVRKFTLELSEISTDVSDSIIEVTTEYCKLNERLKLKTDEVALRMMKLLIRNAGHA